MPPNIEFLGISTKSLKFTYGNCFFVKFSSILFNNFEQEIDTYAKVYAHEARKELHPVRMVSCT